MITQRGSGLINTMRCAVCGLAKVLITLCSQIYVNLALSIIIIIIIIIIMNFICNALFIQKNLRVYHNCYMNNNCVGYVIII